MADTPKGKLRNLDTFDDFDTLSGELPAQHVGLIEEPHDPIDRLMFDDSFDHTTIPSEFATDELQHNAARQNESAHENAWVGGIEDDEVITDELRALERVGHVDEFVDNTTNTFTVSTSEKNNASAEIAALLNKIGLLEKQHALLQQEIQQKAEKAELADVHKALSSNKHEPNKSTRRNPSSSADKQPAGIIAYLGLGTAVVALALTVGLSYSKPETGNADQEIGKFQEQIDSVVTNATHNQQNLQKQFDDLKTGIDSTNTQIADLAKAVQKNQTTSRTTEGVDRKIAELITQNQQINNKIDDLQDKISALKKTNATVVTPQSATTPAKTDKKSAATEDNWTVNLVAFKQDWYAKRKADEFAGKGIPAKVSKTESKGENWYRLSVDGFKSQAEAAGYAAKVKKTLNLDSPWITND